MPYSATLMTQSSRLLIAGLLAAVALSACQKAGAPSAAAVAPDQAPPPVATLPLTDGPAPAAAMAPPATALPTYQVRRARVANPGDRYAYIDRATQASYGYGDAPPDYSFDYEGERPWSWQSSGGYETVVEPLPDGGDRYYYYEPGSDAPYLVRDPQYAYGYEGGALVVVYDAFGHPLPDSYLDRQADFAGRYLYRGQQLYGAARTAPHYGVARDNWYARRQHIEQENAAWYGASQKDQDWRAYHDQYGQAGFGQQQQATWAVERANREAYALRVDQANNAAQYVARDRQAAAAAVAQAQAVNPRFVPRGGTPAPLGGQPAPQPRLPQALYNTQPGANLQQVAQQRAAEQQAAQQQAARQQAAQAQAQARAQAQAQAAATRQAQVQTEAQQRAAAQATARQQAAQQRAAAQAAGAQARAQQQAQATQAAQARQTELQAQTRQRAAAQAAEAQQRAQQQAQIQATQAAEARTRAAQAQSQAQAAEVRARQQAAEAQQHAQQQAAAAQARAQQQAAQEAAAKARAEAEAARGKAVQEAHRPPA